VTRETAGPEGNKTVVPYPCVSHITEAGKKGKGKGKIIPVQVWTGPEDSRRLRLPDVKKIT
jgi:hypothetical protein